MTRRRDLGPVLALVGAGIAVAAVVAGFVLIGGPGHARDQRLDEITEQKIVAVVDAVQCAFNATGSAPATYEAAKATRPSPPILHTGAVLCDAHPAMEVFAVNNGEAPSLGEVTYQTESATHIKVCGSFRVESRAPWYSGYGESYPQLAAKRERGVHCYDLDLIRTSAQASPAMPRPPPPT